MTTQNEAIEIGTSLVVQSETDSYVVYKDENGKFVRKAKFTDFSSIVAETREEKIWLLNLLEGAEDSGHGMKDNFGKEIEVQDVILRKYDKINEDTGELEYGVLTYLLTPEKEAYVTSSKNVYFSIIRIMELFGKPGTPEWVNIKVKILKEKMEKGDSVKIKMVG